MSSERKRFKHESSCSTVVGADEAVTTYTIGEKEGRVDGEDRESGISWSTKERIVGYNPSWPICEYTAASRRVKMRQRRLEPVITDLDALNGWWILRSISIDGMNGTGKSTLAKSMNREYVKVNALCPDITTGSKYNYSPLRSLEYMFFQTLCETGDAFVVWDRCRYSNLIFAYIHHLMSVYKDRTIPGPNDDEPFLYINNMALATGLFMTVSYVESACVQKTPILFIVNSDLRLVAQSLLARGGANDVYNAKEANYQMAQYHVYRYFARLLNAPLIDLNEVFRRTGSTLSEIQEAVRERVDITERLTSDSLLPPPRRESLALHAFCDRHDDTMVYRYSTK